MASNYATAKELAIQATQLPIKHGSVTAQLATTFAVLAIVDELRRMSEPKGPAFPRGVPPGV